MHRLLYVTTLLLLTACAPGTDNVGGDVIDISGDWTEDWSCDETCDMGATSDTFTGTVNMTITQDGAADTPCRRAPCARSSWRRPGRSRASTCPRRWRR